MKYIYVYVVVVLSSWTCRWALNVH